MLPHCSHYIHAHTYSHQNRILCKSYSRCSSNLRESLLNFMVDIKIFWFFLPLNFSLSYKIKSWNLLSFSIEKELSISSKSFIRVDLFAIQKWRRKKCVVVSASTLQGQRGFNMCLKAFVEKIRPGNCPLENCPPETQPLP